MLVYFICIMYSSLTNKINMMYRVRKVSLLIELLESFLPFFQKPCMLVNNLSLP